MAISKIILNGVTQMDLTADTVAANNLIAPNTAHGADGEAVVGTASSGGGGLEYETGTYTAASDGLEEVDAGEIASALEGIL